MAKLLTHQLKPSFRQIRWRIAVIAIPTSVISLFRLYPKVLGYSKPNYLGRNFAIWQSPVYPDSSDVSKWDYVSSIRFLHW